MVYYSFLELLYVNPRGIPENLSLLIENRDHIFSLYRRTKIFRAFVSCARWLLTTGEKSILEGNKRTKVAPKTA